MYHTTKNEYLKLLVVLYNKIGTEHYLSCMVQQRDDMVFCVNNYAENKERLNFVLKENLRNIIKY